MTEAGSSRPRLLVVAGPNGAGKTTITERGLAHEWFEGCEYINPDLIAQQDLGDWNDPNRWPRSIANVACVASEIWGQSSTHIQPSPRLRKRSLDSRATVSTSRSIAQRWKSNIAGPWP